ncbi:hypothetical protein KAI04_03410 [Candidatus Pacearchaeota archaeon]|nr:hypothetical protein [Candidatus Pacearchaeota archaeon]
MEDFIINPIKVDFNPEKITDLEVREVFADERARTLWLAIKPRHLTDQYFNRNCLSAGKSIKKGIDN